MRAGYRVLYGSPHIKKETDKLLKRSAPEMQQRIYDAMKALADNPAPAQAIHLTGVVGLSGQEAKYRLRVGDFRVIYDVDGGAKTVVILAVRRRSEKTYH